MIGAITELKKSVLQFYTSYIFTVQRIHWDDRGPSTW